MAAAVASLNFLRYDLPCHQRAARAMSKHAPSEAPTPTPMAIGFGPVHSPHSLVPAVALSSLLDAASGRFVDVDVGTGQEVEDGITSAPMLRGKASSQQFSWSLDKQHHWPVPTWGQGTSWMPALLAKYSKQSIS
jgi:hypothetical protein